MPRAGVALILGLAIGFATVWVMFDTLRDDEPTAPQVALAVARAAGTTSASCERRRDPPNLWDCTARDPQDLPLSEKDGCGPWVARVDGDRVFVMETSAC
jgi:hypothetical protein